MQNKKFKILVGVTALSLSLASFTPLYQNAVQADQSVTQISVGQGTYYNQRDSQWQIPFGGLSFAATGCVPTVLAMVFTDLSGTQTTPTTVGQYLYNVGEFNNNRFSGTSAKGILSASSNWGFETSVLTNLDQVREALQQGHYVVSAVQHHDKFSPASWGPLASHELVLRGYQNGATYVHDPINRDNIGWHSLEDIWNHQSRNAEDVEGVGVPFIKIAVPNNNSQPVPAGRVAVKRLYDEASGNHWFSTDEARVADMSTKGWTVEGVAFNAPDTGAPVYVVTSPSNYYHFTSNAEEIAGLVKLGWRQGEIVFYAANSGLSVHRLYNPNTGRHHFTSNATEIAGLVAKGWNDEGHAYYVSQ